MNRGSTVFAQVMDFLPMHQSRRCVDRHQGYYRVRSFTCFDQCLCMAFAQLTYGESLGTSNAVCYPWIENSTTAAFVVKFLAVHWPMQTKNRDWRIYRDFAQLQILVAKDLYADEDFGVQLNETIYALDASMIDLCLSVFPCARFRRTKSAVKLYTLLDLRGKIPSFIDITDGKVHDVNVLDILIPVLTGN